MFCYTLIKIQFGHRNLDEGGLGVGSGPFMINGTEACHFLSVIIIPNGTVLCASLEPRQAKI